MATSGIRLYELDRWLEPFLRVIGRKTRRKWAPLYLRGLLGPGERKNLLPMAKRLGLVRARSAAAFHRQHGVGRRAVMGGAGARPICQTAFKTDLHLECAPAGGQFG